MRKLKLQMQVSVDGFVCGPNGEMDWVFMDWDQALMDYVTAITADVDTILMGRKLAEGFIPHWRAFIDNPETDSAGGRKMVFTPKIVFTNTVDENPWEYASLEKGDLKTAVQALKASPGGDIMTYGGASFAKALVAAGLVDEFHLFVNPTAIGAGLSIFGQRTDLKMQATHHFDCGVAVLVFGLK
jgi:dihydrofolate reductase